MGLQELPFFSCLEGFSVSLMVTTFLPTFKLFFFSSMFLVLCFAALSVVRAQSFQQTILFAAVCLLEVTTEAPPKLKWEVAAIRKQGVGME